MPTTLAGYQRVIVNGIPVWKNSVNEYYAYEPDVETNPICIGSETSGFTIDLEKYYAKRLAEYREKLFSRTRVGAQKK
jgi:hypothetical protein